MTAASTSPTQTIPVLSLRDLTQGTPAQRAAFVQGMGDALVDIGFFALTDHGVPDQLIADSYARAKEFFALPLQTRLQYEKAELRGQRGYTSFGREHAKDSDAPDLKEFWHVGRDRAGLTHPGAVPYDNLWPSELPGFRTAMSQLFASLDACAWQLLGACAEYMGESPDFLTGLADSGDTVLRVIHYPPVPADRHPASVRAAAHEDINLITLLCEATAGGLELLQRDGSWRPVHALQGQIVVDAGDMLQHLSNGWFKATTHRVVNPDDSRDQRFSMPFFVHPRGDADLTPRPGCIARTGGQPRFANRTAGQYLAQRLAEIGL